jgi:hypothetical protein
MAKALAFLGGILGGAAAQSQQAQVAEQALSLKNGAVEVLIDAENKYLIFRVAEKEDLQPIVFDLLNNQILNATFPGSGSGSVPA